jgi:hypothetical protein
VRRAAYDRRAAAASQLRIGAAVAEELDLDDFACSPITDWCVHISCVPPQDPSSQHVTAQLHMCVSGDQPLLLRAFMALVTQR